MQNALEPLGFAYIQSSIRVLVIDSGHPERDRVPGKGHTRGDSLTPTREEKAEAVENLESSLTWSFFATTCIFFVVTIVWSSRAARWALLRFKSGLGTLPWTRPVNLRIVG